MACEITGELKIGHVDATVYAFFNNEHPHLDVDTRGDVMVTFRLLPAQAALWAAALNKGVALCGHKTPLDPISERAVALLRRVRRCAQLIDSPFDGADDRLPHDVNAFIAEIDWQNAEEEPAPAGPDENPV
jgi:hypothetical protein